ncbi:MAG TPA: HD domain-containing phosphohydrolase [Gallionella sp.]|nr:HD domain-containing phosphohydrolase [Gallionella sp.]
MEQAAINKELRVLMLEDTPTDAELIEHELRKAGIAFISKRVEMRDAFVDALDDFKPDVILSDYHLPDFDGMTALTIVRKNHPEMPVIMVTGTLSDVEAVELIDAGARDYVLKDRLARLAPAVERVISAELGIRARKSAEKALRESEAKFRALVESTSDWIWEIDEHGIYTYASPQIYEILGYTVEEIIGKAPFDLMPPEEAQRVRGILEALLKERKAFRFLENENRHKDGRIVYMETSATPIFEGQGVFKGYRGIDRDITERKEAEKERRASAEKLEHTLLQTIEAVAATVDARDPYTAGHQRRVAALASAIAHQMGLPEDKIRGLYLAASIHDLGKVHLPAEILSKPGTLNPIEYELVKTHSQTGFNIIKDVQFPWPIAQIVLQHHERLDGSGYPQGLKGEQILPEAKILSVADVVEAMSSHRPYRPGLGLESALDEIAKQRGVLYDPDVVDSCLVLFREKNYAFPADARHEFFMKAAT